MTPLLALTTLSLVGYHLTLDAEMSSPADMSQFINTFENGDTTLYNNHEAQNYVGYGWQAPLGSGYLPPYQFADGGLSLNASPVPTGNLPYMSGMLETYGIFSQSSGYFEIRAKTSAAPGFWPAFWMIPAAYYPEIDILEQPNNSGSTTQYWTHTSTPSDSSGGFTDTGVDLTQGYHRYGFLWTRNSIQYVFDGNLIGYSHSVPPSMVGLEMYMVANLAVGGPGSWPGPPPAGAVSSYGIDYIRAFSRDPAVPEVVQQAISSPDGVDTTPVLALPPPAVPPSIGSGMDSLVLDVSEDAYQGDAQFTVSIDGRQRGAVQTATASHAYGQAQAFTVKGNFGTSAHTVSVNFINDASGGAAGDRNLYVTGASINGARINNVTLNEYSGGAQSFSFRNNPISPISIGTGPDVFLVNLSEDFIKANARWVFKVDGKQQGFTQPAAARHMWGQTQTVALHGSFGPAAHTLSVLFSDGASTVGGAGASNLYIDGVSYDGIAVPNGVAAFQLTGTYALPIPVQQADMLSLTLTEDAYAGDAQAQIGIDGTVLGVTTVAGPQTVSYSGNWGGPNVPHVVTVDYLNDAYAGPGQDRNLHVQAIVLDSVNVTSQPAHLMISGPVAFNYPVPAVAGGWTKQ